MEDLVIVQIFVRDNNVDQALKALKKKMQREGSFREMKRHVHFEKPSEKRARQKAEAVRRARKFCKRSAVATKIRRSMRIRSTRLRRPPMAVAHGIRRDQRACPWF